MGHCPGAAALHRQARLGAIQRLDLALLIDPEHQAMRRGVEVKPDHVVQLVGKLRITAEFEGPQPVWGETMDAPDLLHRADRQTHDIGHRPAGPVGGFTRRGTQGALDQLRDDRLGHRRFAGLARLVVQQRVDPGLP